MSVSYNGTQSFIRQVGGGVTYDQDGNATQTIIWRGPIHKLPAFRNSFSASSPDFANLKLNSPPNEIYEGAYARVVATYGGVSSEVSNNFPDDIDNEDQEIPSVTESANFQISSVVISVVDEDLSYNGSSAEYRIDYRAPINSVSYTRSSKPARVSARSRSGITTEADPKILSVATLNIEAAQHVALSGSNSAVKLMQTKYAPGGEDPKWKVEVAAIDFRRSTSGRQWRCSETWTKLIVQDANDEDFD